MGIFSAIGVAYAFVSARPGEPLADRIAVITAVMAGVGALVGVAIWLSAEL